MSKAQISRIIEENAYAIYLCAFVKTKNAPARRRRVKEENKKTDNNNIEDAHRNTLRGASQKYRDTKADYISFSQDLLERIKLLGE